MKKYLTPAEAYKRVAKIAESHDMSLTAWAIKCGVHKGTVSKWKEKIDGTVTVSMLERLGVKI